MAIIDTLKNILASKTTWGALLVTAVPALFPASRQWIADNSSWLPGAIAALFAALPSPIQKGK